MRIEGRYSLDSNRRHVLRGIVLIAEYKKESELMDAVFGPKVDESGLIGIRKAECRLSDGYGEHYIFISVDELND